MALQVGRGGYMMLTTGNIECLYASLEAIPERLLNDLVIETRNGIVVPTHAKINKPSERAYGTEIELMKSMYIKGALSEKLPLR